MIFVDSSAFYAIVDATDPATRQARRVWESLPAAGTSLITSNYVTLEATTLIQRRLGMQAARDLQPLLGVCSVHFINEALHERSLEMLLTAERRKLSLVDCSSFVLMRNFGIKSAFAYDKHFAEFGFQTI